MDILKKYNKDAANENDSRVELFKSLDTDKIVYKNKYGILITLNNENLESSGAIITTTLEVISLITNNELILGQFYLITDADPTLYGGTTVFVQAISTNKLSLSGEGIFYTPKYDPINTGRGIWDLVPYTFNIESFNFGAPITFSGVVTQDSTTGTGTGFSATIDIFDGYFTVDPIISTYGQGYQSGDLVTILGSQIGGTDGVDDLIFKITNAVDYQIGGTAFWGGMAWTNLTGLIGTSVDKYTLDSNWEVIPFNSTDYNISIDAIHYDYANDRIIKREDKIGNEVSVSNAFIAKMITSGAHPIKDFQWGNPGTYQGIGYAYGCIGNKVLGSLFECINFRCNRLSFNTITMESIVKDNIVSNNFNKNSVSGSYINGNTTNSITSNVLINDSSISDNFFPGLFGGFYGNILESSGIYGNITSVNSNGIKNNTLKSSFITYNTGDFIDISYNTLITQCNIQYNTFNSGTISDNHLSSNSAISANIINYSIRNIEFNNSTLDTITYIDQLQKLTIKDSYISTQDLSTAVDIYGIYVKNIFTNSASVIRLSYINAADALIVTNITN